MNKEQALTRCGIFAANKDREMSDFYKRIYFTLRDKTEEERADIYTWIRDKLSYWNRLITPAIPRVWFNKDTEEFDSQNIIERKRVYTKKDLPRLIALREAGV